MLRRGASDRIEIGGCGTVVESHAQLGELHRDVRIKPMLCDRIDALQIGLCSGIGLLDNGYMLPEVVEGHLESFSVERLRDRDRLG